MVSLRCETRDRVLTLTLDRPATKNSLSVELVHELTAALTAAAREPDDVRVVVLTGASGSFCTGADLSDPAWEEVEPAVRMEWVNGMCRALHDLPQPSVSAVAGVAAGGGANLALGSDLVIAATSARFIEIFARVGMTVDAGGSWLLPRLIGLRRALEATLLTDPIDAEQALDWGLVNRVVADESLAAETVAVAARLAGLPAAAVRGVKRLMHDGVSRTFDAALDAEAASQSIQLAGPDVAEAVAAFQEHRPPSLR